MGVNNELTHELKRIKLIRRLENNYDDFLHSISGVSRQMLINMANRIAAFSEIYIYFAKEHDWDDEYDVDFFLLFKNPLTVMVDTWLEYHDGMMVDVGGILSGLSCKETVIAEYPLAESADLQLCGAFNFKN